jgi:hypothetical protein
MKDFTYAKVVLLAHSLGAIVVRRALLEAVSKNRPWARKIDLILFAPAHLGANVLNLIAQTHVLSGLLGFALRYRYQTLTDLEPQSQTLAQLAAETRAALGSGPNAFLTARLVCFGDGDKVVDPNRFVQDPDPDILLGKNHCDVCKPGFAFKQPFDLICHYL